MKIVAAVDGSKYGRWALEWIAQIPFASRPDVTALHVLDVVSLKAPFMVQPVIAGNAQLIRKEIQRLVRLAKRVKAESKSLLSTLKLKGTVVTVKGAAAQCILRSAPGPRGLIVMGSHGLTPIDRFMLGSVSTRVTTHASCSTLVVKEPSRPLRRLLFATDGSKPSEKALRFLLRELAASQAGKTVEILVMHSIPFLGYPELKQAAQAMVGDAANTLANAGYQATEIVQLGDPADQIMKIAGKHKVDLVVTGAKGMGAVARFLLGSVSMKLVQHSPCSVLVVR